MNKTFSFYSQCGLILVVSHHLGLQFDDSLRVCDEGEHGGRQKPITEVGVRAHLMGAGAEKQRDRRRYWGVQGPLQGHSRLISFH